MSARFLGFCCLLFGLAVWFVQPAFAAEPRVALVIGNSNYGPEIGKLKNPAHDAELMAATLKSLGFSVDLVLNADQKAMKRAVKSFGAKLREAGSEATGLFYYAGHGVQVEGENFLLPVGAEIEAEADVEIESIAAADVMTQMESAGNRVNLVFLDACRNNPLAKASRSGTRGLARLDAPRGSFVGYSTAPGDVAADGDGANSPYALALADELRKPGISVEEAHRNVRARVLAQTGDRQTPWDSSSLTGPVIFTEKVAEPAPQPAAPPPQPAIQQQAAIDKEVVFWESIKDSVDPAEYEAYLQQYPEGSFAPLAKAKIAKLTKTSPVSTAAPSAPVESQAAPQQAATGRQLTVTGEVKEQIDQYLARATNDGWALAVASDGSTAASIHCGLTMYAGDCPGMNNRRASAERGAIKRCGGTAKCFLLYQGTTKVVNTEIVVRSAALGTEAEAAPAPVAAPPVTPASAEQLTATTQDTVAPAAKMSVSADALAEITTYLENAEATSRYWALAISNDGRHTTVVSCPKTGYSGNVGCREGPVASQTLTNQLALKTCGAGCQLLYVGKSKVAGVEIVQQ